MMACFLCMSAFSANKTLVLSNKNTVVLNQAFTFSSVAEVQEKLAKLSATTRDDLFLVLDTPGGSISAGLALIDFANSLPNKVHTVTLFAASMGYITAQSLGKRYIVPSGTLMSHRAFIGGLSGQVPGEATARIKHVLKMVTEISEDMAKRIGIPYKQYMKEIYNELWLTSREAVKRNHADEVIVAKCDKSLSGTYVKKIRTFFGTYKVTFSKCPLIRGALKVETSNDYIKRFIEDLFNYENKRHFDLTL